MADMEKKKNTIWKDAAVLFVITLISGLLLGLVNDFTADVIAQNKIEANIKIYQEVFKEAVSFEENKELTGKTEEFAKMYEQSGKTFGSVSVDGILEAKDSSGAVIGYLITSTSQDGYGGKITVNLGVTADGVTTGLGLLEINESPGLGDNANREDWRAQFAGKKVSEFKVTKQGAGAEDEIDAISGATMTSSAVANAVNAALFFLENSVLQ